jgi:hypothetical protein
LGPESTLKKEKKRAREKEKNLSRDLRKIKYGGNPNNPQAI